MKNTTSRKVNPNVFYVVQEWVNRSWETVTHEFFHRRDALKCMDMLTYNEQGAIFRLKVVK